jgi:hypothetical protein
MLKRSSSSDCLAALPRLKSFKVVFVRMSLDLDARENS